MFYSSLMWSKKGFTCQTAHAWYVLTCPKQCVVTRSLKNWPNRVTLNLLCFLKGRRQVLINTTCLLETQCPLLHLIFFIQIFVGGTRAKEIICMTLCEEKYQCEIKKLQTWDCVHLRKRMARTWKRMEPRLLQILTPLLLMNQRQKSSRRIKSYVNTKWWTRIYYRAAPKRRPPPLLKVNHLRRLQVWCHTTSADAYLLVFFLYNSIFLDRF